MLCGTICGVPSNLDPEMVVLAVLCCHQQFGPLGTCWTHRGHPVPYEVNPVPRLSLIGDGYQIYDTKNLVKLGAGH